MLGFKKSWIILNECIFSVKSKHRLYIDSNGENRAPYKSKALFRNNRFMLFWNVLGIFSILLEYMLLTLFPNEKALEHFTKLKSLISEEWKVGRRGYLPIQYIFPHLPYGESAFRQVMKMDFKSTQINVQSKGMYGKKGTEQQKMFWNSFSFILWTRIAEWENSK